MSDTTLNKVHKDSDQSIWLDNLSRPLISSGDLQKFVEKGVRGVTSNPSIFQKALENSDAYTDQLLKCRAKNLTPEQTYWELVKKDIKDAADVLRPVYDESHHADGYVSVEVDPRLAHDTAGTVAQAIDLWKALKRPNIMIKVPATKAGIPAVAELIAKGINVNVTLIFSLSVCQEVIDAYMTGLEQNKGDVHSVASVASFFVSRLDSVVDEALPADSVLRGKAAIAQAHRAYRIFQDNIASPRWKQLAALGAMVQRPLWASTSTKNPDYPDTLYIDSLVAPHTVNTVPQATLDAYFDHGLTTVAITDERMAEAGQTLAQLASHDIDIRKIAEKLESDGVSQFVNSFNDPLEKLKN